MEQLINKRVKVVFRDGARISVVTGEVQSYNSDVQIIEIYDEHKETTVFVNIKSIDKIEVLQ